VAAAKKQRKTSAAAWRRNEMWRGENENSENIGRRAENIG